MGYKHYRKECVECPYNHRAGLTHPYGPKCYRFGGDSGAIDTLYDMCTKVGPDLIMELVNVNFYQENWYGNR